MKRKEEEGGGMGVGENVEGRVKIMINACLIIYNCCNYKHPVLDVAGVGEMLTQAFVDDEYRSNCHFR